jgi:hypothetical protein
LCVISTVVPINFLVKSEESTFIVATCRDKTRDNTFQIIKCLQIPAAIPLPALEERWGVEVRF